jgi:hypothetical protein
MNETNGLHGAFRFGRRVILITAKTGLAPEQRNCKFKRKECVLEPVVQTALLVVSKERRKERKMDRGQS